jgi:hypothetical protein
MIARACFRRVHRITSGKPGRLCASSWEREFICGRCGWLSKPFISVDASNCEKSSLNCTNLSASHCKPPVVTAARECRSFRLTYLTHFEYTRGMRR